MRYTAILAASAILCGCASSGGGSGALPPPSPDPGIPSPPPPSADPNAYKAFETNEYKSMGGHMRIGTAHAYVDGARGQGVKVAVVDSGIDAAHPDLAGRVSGGWDYINNVAAPTADDHGHGTHVAGIIGAAKNGTGVHGVAPEVSFVPFKMLASSGTGIFSDAIGRDIVSRGRAAGVDLFSNSWGIPGDVRSGTDPNVRWPAMLEEVRKASAEGRVFVWSSGNEGQANPSTLGALPDKVADLRPDDAKKRASWLAVTALDTNGEIASYANRCGYAASWCLAAPGSWINSLAPGGSTTLKSGTSMAQPHVAGAIALLKSRFNTLDANQIAYRLLVTANKSGIYADQSIYGQGLLDLQAAYQPVGGLSLPVSASVNGQVVGASSAGIFVSAQSGDALRSALAGRKVLMVDNLQRATFWVDGSQLVHAKSAPASTKAAAVAPVREVARGVNGATRFSFFDGAPASRLGFGSAFLSETNLGALSFSMSSGVDGGYSSPMKLAADYAPEIARFVAGGSMLGGLAEHSVSARYDFSGGTSVSSQLVTNDSGRRSIMGVEKAWKAYSIGLTATVRSDLEDGASLSQTGKAPAHSLQLTGAYRLADNVSLVGALGQERQSVSESLGEFGMRALQTKSTAVAGARWSFDGGRRLGVAYRVAHTPGGKYEMNLPMRADDDGSIRYERVKFSGASRLEHAAALSFEQQLRGGFMAFTLQAAPGASAATLTINRRF